MLAMVVGVVRPVVTRVWAPAGLSETVGGGMVKIEAKIRDGLEQDIAKDIVKRIKGAELKVQASIQGDEIRCTAKKIDDLQAVIAMLNADAEIKVPLQFVNMKRD